MVDAVRACARRGVRLVSFCTGAFTLAAAGVLDGRRATTHWRWAEEFRRRFPRVRLEPDVLFVDDGDVLTAAGSAADVELGGARVSWLVPVLGLSLVAAVVAYVAGIGAARLLGAKIASFVGLTEVVFAVLVAWLLLGQVPAQVQLLGGALIVGGIALVRLDELRAPTAPAREEEPALR